ncbi:conjugal transfer protein TraG [Bradyrhizobium elkanii]|uniref:conjugal transfer protein TraG n=1 Tax=Bradyrhizobium elkanii TaxID=29448 RepID=UPI00209CE29B|nr:conjugal transfer protein TraG [Bradyrhizobium elkanii]MCP1970626.1 type IV secretion system protein VirD4 [Bradyrhizobium elkanii]MCS4107867.1 type IV secretion system protein VirD4 [Bradyrhizobium elkanii]
MFPAKIYVGQITVVFGIVIASTWGATQWTAAALGFQARLGPPWFAISGYPVYLPWRLFEWWFAYEPYAPEIFEEGGAIAAAGGIAGALFAIVNSVWRARQNQLVTTYGSARWANVKEIRAAGLLAGRGVFLGRFEDYYLRHDGPEHVMCFAPTRSGKGVGLVLPTLLSWTSSAVVHDIKGENWELTSGWRSTFSHCLLFNPTDPASARYNPLLEVRKGAAEVRDVQNIADILVDPEGALERRSHWEKTSHSLLVGVILHVLYAEQQKTLTRVTEILADPAQSFEKTLRIMLATNHLGTEAEPKVHPVVAATARELLNKSENERSGVLSTAVSFLGLYRDPVVSRNTESCDWRIADLVGADRPVTLYLVVPPSDNSRTKPLIRLILNQIGRRLTESLNVKAGDAKHRQLLLMLDEFPALGRLDFFESALAFMAGYGIRAYLIAQSLNQIAKAYGENNAILDNCHVRIAFAANDERTAKRISDALGTATELRAQRNYAGHRLAPWLGHVMVSRQETARPLLTPGEVMQLPQDQAIVLVSGLAPVRARKLRHYEDSNFVTRLRPSPPLGAGEYRDRPAARPSDWGRQIRAVDLRLATLPYRDLIQAGAEEGGLKQQLPLFEETAPQAEATRFAEERLLDDDADVAADRNQMQRAANASSSIRSAHAVTRDDDDLLPAF